MSQLRSRRAFVLFVLAVAVLTACVPAISSAAHDAVLVPAGLVIATAGVVVLRRIAVRSNRRPVALLSIDFFRAPPALLALV